MRPLRKLVWSLGLMTIAANGASAADPANTLVIQLSSGNVVAELRPDVAPQHVARLKELASEKFYDGVVFHRVIPGFMAQTGDPTGTGTGGSPKPDLPAEFSDVAFERGTIGMARTQDPDSANSQFFICFAGAEWLNGQYTVVGQITEGMELVDKIAVGEPPRNPDKMLTVRVQTDAP